MQHHLMKIEPSLMSAAGRVAAQGVEQREIQASSNAGGSSVVKTGSGDAAVLSNRAKDVRGAQKAFAEQPDVRTDRVEAAKAQIANGTYEVDAELIADRLMADVM